MRRVAMVQALRINSSRLPGKVLERIGGRTLAEIGLEKIAAASREHGCVPVAALFPSDGPLLRTALAVGCEIMVRDKSTRNAETYADVFKGWAEKLRDHFDWVVDLNVVCHPFLRAETVGILCEAGKQLERPFVTVVKKRGIIWHGSCKHPIIGCDEVADTRNNPVYWELAHVAYGMPVDMLGDVEAITANQEKLELCLRPEERIDVDTEEDLAFARRIMP